MDTSSPPPNRYHPERYQAARKRQAATPLAYAPARDILAALGRYGYLTVPQILRLLYSPSSRSFVNTWLKALRDNGYVHNDNWLFVASEGVKPRVWTFTEKGRQQLMDNGQTELPRIHHRRRPQSFVLDHTIAVNESLITCELLATKSEGVIELLGIRSDELLHKMPIEIGLENDRKANVVPDGWVCYGIGEIKKSFCLEVDRATEDQPRWRAKIAGYLKALSGDPSPYAARFGMRSTQMLTIVRPKEQREVVNPEKRLAELKLWTELELSEQGKKSWAPIFQFTTATPEALDARVFFGSPLWEMPFQTGKESVLPGVL